MPTGFDGVIFEPIYYGILKDPSRTRIEHNSCFLVNVSFPGVELI